MKYSTLQIALAVLTFATIPAIYARDAGSSSSNSSESSSSQRKSASSHAQPAASDRLNHKNRTAHIRAQKRGKNATATKSKRNPPAANPEIIEGENVELPNRDDADNLDDNSPALMPSPRD